MSDITTTLPNSSYGVTLRDYQQQGVQDIRAALGRARRVCYVLPTGGGKTVIFSYIAWATGRKGTRVMILGHRQEIADQISAALETLGVAHGSIRPGEAMTGDHVQVAMVQTLANRIRRNIDIAAPDLIIIDEAHHATATTWQSVMLAYPRAFVLGVTATPERLDGAGLRDVGFEELVLGPDVAELIKQGHLAPFRYLGATLARFDDVRTIAGDYDAHEVEARMSARAVVGDVVANYRQHLEGKTCIAFCVTVAHARMVADAYNAAGIPAASIDGGMSRDARRDVVDALRTGAIKVLTSCNVISEGFDAPAVGGCQLLRPTQSFAMFRQQIGRCLRPKADGSAAIILDHVGNFKRHGLPDDPHDWSLDATKRTTAQRKEVRPSRQCKTCGAVFPLSARQEPCAGVPDCLFQAVVPEQVAGELVEVARDPLEAQFRPAWARGRDLRFDALWRLQTYAEGRADRLQQIAQAKGYKKGWAWHAEGAWARGERPSREKARAWVQGQRS